MMNNINMVPSTEGFIGIADIPNYSNVQKPSMNLWANEQVSNQNEKTNTTPSSKEPKMPFLVHVYVGTLTVLGLYFLYKCTKK